MRLLRTLDTRDPHVVLYLGYFEGCRINFAAFSIAQLGSGTKQQDTSMTSPPSTNSGFLSFLQDLATNGQLRKKRRCALNQSELLVRRARLRQSPSPVSIKFVSLFSSAKCTYCCAQPPNLLCVTKCIAV